MPLLPLPKHTVPWPQGLCTYHSFTWNDSVHAHTGPWLHQVVYIYNPSTQEFRTNLGYMRPRLKLKVSHSRMVQQVKVLALWAWGSELDPWDPCKHRSRELTSGSCPLTHVSAVACA